MRDPHDPFSSVASFITQMNDAGQSLSAPPMTDSYPANSHYVPQYYPAPAPVPNHGHVHVVSPPPRPENTQRKRPKYTRSKTGCLTCRVKKIKCDETKPNCMRCTHGQRDCTWPEGVPPRKKPAPRKDAEDGRPSTAESSGRSEASTPPTRDHSPSQRAPIDLSLPPLAASRRHTEPYLQLHPLAPEPQPLRRQSGPLDRSHQPAGYPSLSHVGSSNTLPLIPEMSSQRYDHQYPGSSHPQASRGVPPPPPSSSMRHITHQSVHQWNSPQVMPSIEPLQPYFHSTQERNLIRHYCDNSVSLIVAAPSETNPIVAANLPLIFSRPPGDPSAEALRNALLGVSAIHQSFLLARSGGSTQDGADQMLGVANTYRVRARHLLLEACSTVDGTQSDAALAACAAISLMDIFSGGRNWLRNMNFAKSLVAVRGGPGAVLASGLGTARTRVLLEILSVYDIFGCLATGQEPTILHAASDSWWHADAPGAVSFVEQIFGMSRGFIPLLARVTAFVARALRRAGGRITEVDPAERAAADADETAACHALYHALEAWADGTAAARVQAGDDVYRRAAQILLLRDVLRVPRTDALVQQCAAVILALVGECCAGQMGVDLIWPVIIAGTHVAGGARDRVLMIFEAFRAQCCYEIDTSEQIVREVWRRVDLGSDAEWRGVMRDLDLDVLVL